MKSIAITLISISLVFAGCSPGTDGPKTGKKQPVVTNSAKTAADLLPLTEGNAWTYFIESQVVLADGRSERTSVNRIMKVGKVTKGANETKANLEFYDENKKLIATVFLVSNSKGIYQTGAKAANANALSFSSPLPWAPYPYKLDETIRWNGSGPYPGVGGVGAMQAGITGRGQVEADSLAGRFKCERFESVMVFTRDKIKMRNEQIAWFSPGVGLVRNKETIATVTGASQTSVMMLKSYTVK